MLLFIRSILNSLKRDRTPQSGRKTCTPAKPHIDELRRFSRKVQLLTRKAKKAVEERDEMLREKRLAEAAARAKTEFLAHISHEIRTPLNGVLGMAQLLGETELTSLQRDFLIHLVSSATWLSSMIDDILDYSKLETGRLELVITPFNVRDLLPRVEARIEETASRRGMVVVTAVQNEVPVGILGDAARIEQVLWNLADNALKFSPHEGAILLYLGIEAVTESAVILHFAVTDTGIGIAPDKQKVIFDPLTQGDSSATKEYKGTGMGLAICRRLVEMMGGRIWVRSSPFLGSAFHFTLELEKIHKNIPVESLHPDQAAAMHGRNGDDSPHILVAEDNPVNRRLTCAMLEKAGFKVSVADDGEMALSKNCSTHFDLILMDCQMPKLDGYSAAARIRELEAESGTHVPIIAVTAGLQESDRIRALSAGMDDYVPKPISKAELLEAIERALRED